MNWSKEEWFIQKRKKRSSLIPGGQKCFNPCHVSYLNQDDLMKKLICTRTSWRIGCQSAYYSTRPGAKYVASAARDCRNDVPPQKQRGPLPSFLYKSFFFYAFCKETAARDKPRGVAGGVPGQHHLHFRFWSRIPDYSQDWCDLIIAKPAASHLCLT